MRGPRHFQKTLEWPQQFPSISLPHAAERAPACRSLPRRPLASKSSRCDRLCAENSDGEVMQPADQWMRHRNFLKEEHQKAGAAFAFVYMDWGAISETVNRGRKR
jgi:hypothetical protein